MLQIASNAKLGEGTILTGEFPSVSRPATTRHERIDFIDFAKGYSVFCIVLFHYSQGSVSGVLAKAIMFGGAGVHLLIFLSGFGLGLNYQNMSLPDFWKRRFTRVLIPYYIFVSVVFLINLFCHVYPIYPNDHLYAFLGHVFLFKMFDERIMTSMGYHLWFISTILQLYIIFPLLIKAHKRCGHVRFGLATVSISIIYWCLVAFLNAEDRVTVNNSLFRYLWEFCLGIIAATCYRNGVDVFWERSKSVLLTGASLGIAATGALAIVGGTIGMIFNDIPALIGFASLAALLFVVCSDNMVWLRRAVIFTGKASYELYLVHVFVLDMAIVAARMYGHHLRLVDKMLLLFPLSVLISFLFVRIDQKFGSLLLNRHKRSFMKAVEQSITNSKDEASHGRCSLSAT